MRLRLLEVINSNDLKVPWTSPSGNTRNRVTDACFVVTLMMSILLNNGPQQFIMKILSVLGFFLSP